MLTAVMRLLLLGCLISVLHAQDSLLPKRAAPGENLWKASIASLTVAHVIDVKSSWGKRELNPVLASPSGNFGGQGALIKMGVLGGVVGLEYLLTRGHPSGRFYRGLAILNFASSAAIGATAAHNYTVGPSPR
jgi:hypothetical protein